MKKYVFVIVGAILFVGIMIVITPREKSEKGEKLTVSPGISGNSRIFKGTVKEKDVEVYNGNVIVRCNSVENNDDIAVMIDVFVPLSRAHQLSVGDTVKYVEKYVTAITKPHGDPRSVLIGFWVDENLIKK